MSGDSDNRSQGDPPRVLPLATFEAERALVAQRRLSFAAARGLHPADLRPLPWPFTGWCTIASDADRSNLVAAESTGSIIRERYGLPIADSFFPHFFVKMGFGEPDAKEVDAGLAKQKGDRPQSDDFSLPRFVEATFPWMRRFHQGWFDTVHGWLLRIQIRIGDDVVIAPSSPDDVRRPPPSRVRRIVNRVAMQVASDLPPALGGSLRRRLKFRSPPGWHILVPPRWFIARYRNPTVGNKAEIVFLDGDKPVGRVSLDEVAGDAPRALVPYVVDLFEVVGTDPDLLRRLDAELRISGDVRSVELRDPVLVSWTRSDIAEQKLVLEAFNLRASTYTSHGGGYNIAQGKAPSLDAADARGVADNADAVHYAFDLFREYGFDFFNTASNTSRDKVRDIRDLVFPRVLNDGRAIYDFNRFLSQLDGPRATPLAGDATGANRSLSTGLGAQIDDLLERIDAPARGGVIYTHCYAKGADDPTKDDVTTDGLFNASTHASLERLASAYYGLAGDAPPPRRIFVAPTSAMLRFSQVIRELPHHAWCDATGNTIQIESWNDPLTGCRVPDPAGGLRQLRFATFYVADAPRARVFLDGSEVEGLIRNPADESGRESVTIADTGTPTPLIDPSALGDGRDRMHETTGLEMALDAGDEGEGITLRLADSHGSIVFRPHAATLANHTYVYLSARGDLENARLLLEIVSADGLKLSAGSADDGREGTFEVMPGPDPRRLTWILPFHRLLGALAEHERRAPVSRIEEVRVTIDARPGAEFVLRDLSLLRDDDRPLSEGFVVGGRVPDWSGIVEVRMRFDGRVYATPVLPSGVYVFLDKVRHGTVVTVEGLLTDGRTVAPLAGPRVRVVRDTFEVDFG